MKVILLDYVYKHGVAGEVIDVADGFARNYLIPRKLAVKATPGELNRAAKLREQAAAKRAALENRMNELALSIDGVELIFGRRAASTGKLFGSVTTQEIADALLEETGVDINRRRISVQSLRELGEHDVAVRLGTETAPILKVIVVRDDELMEFLAAREAAENVEEALEEMGEEPAEAIELTEAEAAGEVEIAPEEDDTGEPQPVAEEAPATEEPTSEEADPEEPQA
jgi:large subunit ribosomal protein L9